MKTIRTFNWGGGDLTWYDDGSVIWIAEFTVDADGSPRAYHSKGSPPGLDYLANAGHPGNWWGLACNSAGVPFVQGKSDPSPGFFVSTTSYKVPGFRHGDPRRELNSEKVPFIVVPGPLIKALPGAVLGCWASVQDVRTGQLVEAMVGDVGPAKHLGEGSIASATQLGLSGDPKRGGSSRKVFKFTIRPGVSNVLNFPLQPLIGSRTMAAIEAIADFHYQLAA